MKTTSYIFTFTNLSDEKKHSVVYRPTPSSEEPPMSSVYIMKHVLGDKPWPKAVNIIIEEVK